MIVCYAQDFYEKAICYFQMAEYSLGKIKRYYKIAGHTICLAFAGPALIDLITPALAHLEIVCPAVIDLTIHIADGYSSGIPLCLPRWNPQEYLSRGEISTYSNNHIATIYDFHTGALNIINTAAGSAVFWVNDFRLLPWWVSGSPLQRIINYWMMSRNKQLTHAAAVGNQQGGVLLAGQGGSGKSTTTIACINAGLKYVSEDYCLISTDKQPTAYSVYNSAKLNPDTLERFANLKPCVANTNKLSHEKALIFQHQFYPERLTDCIPIKAVLLPVVRLNEKPCLKRVSKIEGILALAPSTMFQLSNCGAQTMRLFRELLDKVPVYRLVLSHDLSAVTDLINERVLN